MKQKEINKWVEKKDREGKVAWRILTWGTGVIGAWFAISLLVSGICLIYGYSQTNAFFTGITFPMILAWVLVALAFATCGAGGYE